MNFDFLPLLQKKYQESDASSSFSQNYHFNNANKQSLPQQQKVVSIPAQKNGFNYERQNSFLSILNKPFDKNSSTCVIRSLERDPFLSQ